MLGIKTKSVTSLVVTQIVVYYKDAILELSLLRFVAVVDSRCNPVKPILTYNYQWDLGLIRFFVRLRPVRSFWTPTNASLSLKVVKIWQTVQK